MEDNLFNYFTRVDFEQSDLEQIVRQIQIKYALANVKNYHVIETGYEDFNVYLETLNKKYVIKFFSNERTDENIEHYIKIVKYISEQNFLSIPKVFKCNEKLLGEINYNNKSIKFFVMEYINGKTIYDLNKQIDLKTIIKIVFDILKYNCVNNSLKQYLMSPEAKKFKQYDMWSYENFLEEYENKSKFLSEEDKELIEPIALYYRDMLKRYENYSNYFKNKPVMPPYMSAHNDFISTNIILNEESEPYYIDFSVSSIALNFVDIAIFGCDTVLCDGIDSKKYSMYLKIISYILYRTHVMEYNLYPSAVSVQHAIHILIANYYKVCKHVESDENNYFLELGRKGIRFLNEQNMINEPVFNWVKKDGWYQRAELNEKSEYSEIKKIIEEQGLTELIERNIKEYHNLYNKNKTDENFGNIKLDDLYRNGYDWLYSCIENMKLNDIVMAISFCNDNEWNGEKEEKLWTNLNIDALNRNILMKRIFVYPDNKKSLVLNNRDINKFLKYKKDNLELSFISQSKVEEILRERIDFISPGILVFNDDIAFKDVIDDEDNRGYTIFDKEQINKYYEIYEILKENSDK